MGWGRGRLDSRVTPEEAPPCEESEADLACACARAHTQAPGEKVGRREVEIEAADSPPVWSADAGPPRAARPTIPCENSSLLMSTTLDVKDK